jgi:hypothetical protein
MKDVLRRTAAAQAGCVASWQLRKGGAVVEGDRAQDTRSAPPPRRRLRHRRRARDPPAALVGRHPHRPRQRPGLRERRSRIRDPAVGRRVRGDRQAGERRPPQAGRAARLPHEAPPRHDPERPPHHHARAHRRRPLAPPRRQGPAAHAPQRDPPQAPDDPLARCPSEPGKRQAATAFAERLAGAVRQVEAPALPLGRRGARGRDARGRRRAEGRHQRPHRGRRGRPELAGQRLIVEIDGGTYHQDKLEDARKTAVWRAAGWQVERVPAAAVYDNPERLIRAARRGS